MPTITVNAAGGAHHTSINAAIAAAVPGDTIEVASGTYNENVIITKSVTLVSTGGRENTIINGSSGFAGQGTVEILPGVNNVTLGGPGQGFKIVGFDDTPAIERAAVYLTGAHSGLVIQGNELVANGGAALLGEWGSTLTNIVVNSNVISGATFTGATPADAGSDQWTVPNVPRQLVVLGNPGGPQSNITFTNNEVSGTAGGYDQHGTPTGNFLVTIDAANATISGNEFTGTTFGTATQLRTRQDGTDISDNTFTNDQGGNTGATVLNNPTGVVDDNTITGTDGPDTLNGTVGDDVIIGLDGDDVIDGRGGNDTIDGGLGADTVDMSGAGANGAFVDLASGIAFSTATGIDTLTNIENVEGSTGADSLNGNGDANVLTGGDGNDILTGRGGADTIDGGAGLDAATFSGSASDYTFAAGAGNSVTVTGLDGQDTLAGVEMLTFASGPEVWIVSNSAELTYALANVGQGGAIKLADGTYSGNFVISQDGVTLESLSGDETAVILNGSFKTDNSVPAGTTVGDFLKTATSYSGASGAGLSVQADDVSIKGITIREYRTGIDLRSNTGLTIDNVVFGENIHGVYKETGSAVVTGFTLVNSHFEDGYQGVIINAGTNAANSGSFSDVLIDNLTFERLVEKGMYFEQLSDAELSNLDMNDVGQFGRATPFGPAGQNGAGIDINLKYLDYSDIHIHDFDFTDVGLSTGTSGQSHVNGGAIHIKARDDGSYAVDKATLDGVTIEDGSIDGTSTGIRIGEPNKPTAGPSDVTIAGVTITGATVGSYDNQTTTTRIVTLGSGADVVNVNLAATGSFSFDGGAGDDSITGGNKDDEIKGGAGSDTIVGGDDVLGDTVVFEKTFASYTIAETSSGVYSVTDKATGNIDVVSQVENFKFSDQTFSDVDVDDTALLTPPPPPPPPPPVPTNTAPTVSAANADSTVQAGTVLSLTIGDGHFADAQNTDLNYTITVEGGTLPSWMTFDTTTGAFTASPTTANVGQFTVVVTASDGTLVASDEFELIVTNPVAPEDPDGTKGNDDLVGDGGDNILDGKKGNDKLTGGDGADTFVLGKKYGHDKVLDFDPLEGDLIDLSGAKGIKDFDDLMANHIKDTDGGLKIIAKDGSSLLLSGDFDADDLTADMFLF